MTPSNKKKNKMRNKNLRSTHIISSIIMYVYKYVYTNVHYVCASSIAYINIQQRWTTREREEGLFKHIYSKIYDPYQYYHHHIYTHYYNIGGKEKCDGQKIVVLRERDRILPHLTYNHNKCIHSFSSFLIG